jgi:hypothetical protein
MTASKDGPARTEIEQHSTIGVAMKDLPKVERAALKKELHEEMATACRGSSRVSRKHALG